MKTTLLVLAIATFNLTFAQTPNWVWAKNISSYIDGKNNNTAVDNDGNVYVVGDFVNSSASIAGITLINGSNANSSDSYIFKFTDEGVLLWYKHISTSGTDTIVAVSTDSNGNVYVIGTIGNDTTLGTVALTKGTNPYYIAKLNSSGDYIWAVQATGNNEYYYYKDIKVDSIGNVFVAGSSYGATFTFGSVLLSIDPQNVTLYNNRPFVLKLNSAGVGQWAKMGTSNEQNPFGNLTNSLAVDNNGGVVMCGNFFHNSLHFGEITLTRFTQGNYYSNMFIVKYDTDGNELWAHNAGSVTMNSNASGNALAIDSNNNVFIGGYFTNEMQIETTTVTGFSGSQFYLAKYNSEGLLQWIKIPYDSNNYTGIKSLATDSSGNVYAGGLTFSSLISFSNSVTLSNLSSIGSFFVAKYNSAGAAVWAKGVSNLNANMDISIDCKTEDDLIVGGTFNTTNIQLGSTILTKSVSPHDLYIARLYAPNLTNEVFDQNSILFYPNPVRNVLHISNLKSTHSYNVFNLLGRLVQKGTVNTDQAQIHFNDLSTGLYIIELTDGFGQTVQKKIMVE